MKWPLVSRRALDLLTAERDRLLEQNAKLLDHVTRIDRREHGLPEVPKAPRPPAQPMPDTLSDYINGYANASIRKELRDRCLRRHHTQGVAWDIIERDVRKEDEAPSGILAQAGSEPAS